MFHKTAALAMISCLALVGCEQAGEPDPADTIEDAGDAMEEAGDNAGDAINDGIDETGDAMDDALDETEDAMDDAGDEVEDTTTGG